MDTRKRRLRAAGLLATVCLLAGLAAAPSEAQSSPRTPAGPPRGGSRAGVHRRVIKIGMHVPLTGASPVPSGSMDKAKDLFFKWLRARHRPIHGRRVRVILKNDNYNPAEAVAACREMVTEDHVFALVGFVGPDQIKACAHYAAGVHVPYISPGAFKKGMNLPQTFATTTTWPDQSSLMADYLLSDLKARKRHNAIVWMNNPGYDDARKAFVRPMRRKDARVYQRSVPTQANTADATAVVQELQTLNVKNTYVLVTPVFFLQMIRAASQQNYHPNWTGIDGASDTLASAGCGFNNGIDGAHFFSAYPAFDDRDQFDKKFDRAMHRFYPNDNADSFIWGAWAQEKVIARLLRKPGRNLTRSRFRWFAERARRVKTGIGPTLHYRPKDHFGADAVHLLVADCATRRWRTERSFVDDF